MEALKNIKEKFEHDLLGATYYVLAIVTAIGSGVIWLLTKLYLTSATTYLVGGMLLLVALGLFLAPRLRRDKPPVINNQLAFEDNVYEVDVSPTGLVITRNHRLRALGDIDKYVFVLRPTGNPTHRFHMRGVGVLKGPLEKRDRITYEVEFPAPLKKGETYDLSFQLYLDDPHRTMKRFFSIGGLGARRMGRVSLTIRFPAEQPQSVCHEICAISTGGDIQPIRDLLPDAKGEYTLRLNGINSNESHVIQWAWNA
jgi:hypothetical protein